MNDSALLAPVVREASPVAEAHAREVAEGKRFEFGKNWTRFLGVLDEERIAEACQSLTEKLGNLEGKSFLDVGCGSGLFSLAAARLGAARIVSIDYDPHSVACARELKRRYFATRDTWEIGPGNCLDQESLALHRQFDVVYTWGVAHHTGNMWLALGNLAPRVKAGGKLYIAIYNDQGFPSRVWLAVKKTYCSGRLGRWAVIAVYFPYFFLMGLYGSLRTLRLPWRAYRDYKKSRGMSVIHDWYDWLGGYPFEVAKPEEIFRFYRDRGFVLTELKTVGGNLGNNEFVFEKRSDGA